MKHKKLIICNLYLLITIYSFQIFFATHGNPFVKTLLRLSLLFYLSNPVPKMFDYLAFTYGKILRTHEKLTALYYWIILFPNYVVKVGKFVFKFAISLFQPVPFPRPRNSLGIFSDLGPEFTQQRG